MSLKDETKTLPSHQQNSLITTPTHQNHQNPHIGPHYTISIHATMH